MVGHLDASADYRQAAGGLAFNITTVRMESEFDNENLQNEVHLVYDYYAPSDRENTTYDLRLYDKDCVTHGENSELPSEFISVSHSDALHLVYVQRPVNTHWKSSQKGST